MDFKDLKLSTGGDIAAAGIGAAIGGLVDAFLFPGNVQTSTVAALTAAGAVGIKRALQCMWEPMLERSQRRRRLDKRVRALLTFQLPTDGNYLLRCLEMWRSGAIEDATLISAATEAEVRALALGRRPQAPELPAADPSSVAPATT
jgi:hypothetical protein